MANHIDQSSTLAVAGGPRLRTARLEIIAANLPLVEAEVASPAKLASALEAELVTWPPPLNDESSLRWTYEKVKQNPEWAGFFTWYVVLAERENRRLIGLVAFKGPPNQNGVLEAGYSVLEKYQNRGIATEATRAIMEWAFRNPTVHRIDAETFPELGASIGVMERCGMSFLGDGSEVRTIRYGVTREKYLKQFPINL